MRISDWSSDVCSSDLQAAAALRDLSSHTDHKVKFMDDNGLAIIIAQVRQPEEELKALNLATLRHLSIDKALKVPIVQARSEEHRGGKECVRTCRSRWSPCH